MRPNPLDPVFNPAHIPFVVGVDHGCCDTHIEVRRYSAHPFIHWLAKFINIKPYVEVTYEHRRPKKSAFMLGKNLVMHPEAHRALVANVTA